MMRAADVLVECLTHMVCGIFSGCRARTRRRSTTPSHAAGSIDTVFSATSRPARSRPTATRASPAAPGVVCTTAGPGRDQRPHRRRRVPGPIPSRSCLSPARSMRDARSTRCGNYHEIDLERIFQPCTKWCGTVATVDEIPAMVDAAFQAMTTGPAAARGAVPAARPDAGQPRPDRTSIALDLQRRPPRLPMRRDRRGRRASRPGASARSSWRAAGPSGRARPQAIRDAGRPARRPGRHHAQRQGTARRTHPLSLGHARSRRARCALPHADVMLAVGCRFTEVMTDWRRMPVPAQLDPDRPRPEPDRDEPSRSPSGSSPTPERRSRRWPNCCRRRELATAGAALWDEARAARPARPEWLIDTLRDVLPE